MVGISIPKAFINAFAFSSSARRSLIANLLDPLPPCSCHSSLLPPVHLAMPQDHFWLSFSFFATAGHFANRLRITFYQGTVPPFVVVLTASLRSSSLLFSLSSSSLLLLSPSLIFLLLFESSPVVVQPVQAD